MAYSACKSYSKSESGPRATLGGYYFIAIMAVAMGLLAVFIFNMATPLPFFIARKEILAEKALPFMMLSVSVRIGLVLVVSTAIPLWLLHRILRPIALCLKEMKSNRQCPDDLMEKARRRLINLPFLYTPINLMMWIGTPALMLLAFHLTGLMDIHAALAISGRSTMVGLISSSIAFFRFEVHSRRHVIPLFFPKGNLAKVRGTLQIPIHRRIQILYMAGTLVPLTILLITLFLLQWEINGKDISASAYGRQIIVFTMVLGAASLISAFVLNYLVACSIREPIKAMLATVSLIREGDYQTRIKVVSNDEIGLLGDAGNQMIQGLAEREKLHDTFGKYVTPEIRDEILSGRIPLQGERRQATVMFADLRGFTHFVENNRPEDVMASLRGYFTAMHKSIRRHRGLVLQFVGDEIEAVFGVPVPFDNHADAAVQAALEMRHSLHLLNQARISYNLPPLKHGVGIHTGPVLAGNSGSEEQSAYALVGDTVNVASRIQEMTKEVGCDILVSQETVDHLRGSYGTTMMAPRQVKGYSKLVIAHKVEG